MSDTESTDGDTLTSSGSEGVEALGNNSGSRTASPPPATRLSEKSSPSRSPAQPSSPSSSSSPSLQSSPSVDPSSVLSSPAVTPQKAATTPQSKGTPLTGEQTPSRRGDDVSSSSGSSLTEAPSEVSSKGKDTPVSHFALPPPFHETSCEADACSPSGYDNRSTLSSLSEEAQKDDEAMWSLSPSTEAMGTPVKISAFADLVPSDKPKAGRRGNSDTPEIVSDPALEPSPTRERSGMESDLTDIEDTSGEDEASPRDPSFTSPTESNTDGHSPVRPPIHRNSDLETVINSREFASPSTPSEEQNSALSLERALYGGETQTATPPTALPMMPSPIVASPGIETEGGIIATPPLRKVRETVKTAISYDLSDNNGGGGGGPTAGVLQLRTEDDSVVEEMEVQKNTDFAEMLLDSHDDTPSISHPISDVETSFGAEGGNGVASIARLQGGLQRLAKVAAIVRERRRRDWAVEARRLEALKDEMESVLEDLLIGREEAQIRKPSSTSLLKRLSSICEVGDFADCLAYETSQKLTESLQTEVATLRSENSRLESQVKLVAMKPTSPTITITPAPTPPQSDPLHKTVILLADERDGLLKDSARLHDEKGVLQGVVRDKDRKLNEISARVASLEKTLSLERERGQAVRTAHRDEERNASTLQRRVRELEAEVTTLRAEGAIEHWTAKPQPLSDSPLRLTNAPSSPRPVLTELLDSEQWAESVNEKEDRLLKQKLISTNRDLLQTQQQLDERTAEVAEMKLALSRAPREEAQIAAQLRETLQKEQTQLRALEKEVLQLSASQTSLAEKLAKEEEEKDTARRLLKTQARTHEASLQSLMERAADDDNTFLEVKLAQEAALNIEVTSLRAKLTETIEEKALLAREVSDMKTATTAREHQYAAQIAEEIEKRGVCLRELQQQQQATPQHTMVTSSTQTHFFGALEKGIQTEKNIDFELLQQAREEVSILSSQLHDAERNLHAAEMRGQEDLREFSQRRAEVLSSAASQRGDLERELLSEKERSWASRQKLDAINAKRQRAELFSPALLFTSWTQTEGEASRLYISPQRHHDASIPDLSPVPHSRSRSHTPPSVLPTPFKPSPSTENDSDSNSTPRMPSSSSHHGGSQEEGGKEEATPIRCEFTESSSSVSSSHSVLSESSSDVPRGLSQKRVSPLRSGGGGGDQRRARSAPGRSVSDQMQEKVGVESFVYDHVVAAAVAKRANEEAVRRAAQRVASSRRQNSRAPKTVTQTSVPPGETVDQVLTKVRQRYRTASRSGSASRSPQRSHNVDKSPGVAICSNTTTSSPRRKPEGVAPSVGLLPVVREAMLRYYGTPRQALSRLPGTRVSAAELRSVMAPCGVGHLAAQFATVLRGRDREMGVPRERLFAALKPRAVVRERGGRQRGAAAGAAGGYAASAAMGGSSKALESLLGYEQGELVSQRRGGGGGGRGGAGGAFLTSSEVIRLETLLQRRCAQDASLPKVTADELLAKCLPWDKATRLEYHIWLREKVLSMKD